MCFFDAAQQVVWFPFVVKDWRMSSCFQFPQGKSRSFRYMFFFNKNTVLVCYCSCPSKRNHGVKCSRKSINYTRSPLHTAQWKTNSPIAMTVQVEPNFLAKSEKFAFYCQSLDLLSTNLPLFYFCSVFFFLLNSIHFFYVVSFHLQISSVILLLLLYANPCFEHLKDQSYNVMLTQRMRSLILVIVTYFTFLKFSPYFL